MIEATISCQAPAPQQATRAAPRACRLIHRQGNREGHPVVAARLGAIAATRILVQEWCQIERVTPVARVRDDASMSSILVSLFVALAIFSGGMAGMYLHRVLPAHHLTRETQDVVRLCIGMISVLSSLVLGLLIATAKGSYDTTDQAVRHYAAELALLNETLRDYGGDASAPRDMLRKYTETLLNDIWPKAGGPSHVSDEQTGILMEHVREQVRALKPSDDGQKWLRDQALSINIDLLRERWLLIGQQDRNVSPIVLVVLVTWICVIFASFGLNAPRNATVAVAFLICALAIGGSIFLILEMDRPLDGVMQISSAPIRNVLTRMDW